MQKNNPISEKSNPNIPPWLLLMAMLQGIVPLTIDMYLPAFPDIAREFVMEQPQVELSISFYLLGLALTQLIFGPLTDRFGRKIPLLCGLCLFLVATLVCAIAPNFETFLAARLLQAIGASSGVVIPRATIRDRLSTRDAAVGLTLLLLVTGITPVIAPMIGSLFAPLIGWRGLFAILFCYGLMSIILICLFFKESLPIEKRIAFKPRIIFQNYFELFKHRKYIGFALTGGLTMAALFAFISSSSTTFIKVYGVSQIYFSLFFGLNALGLMAGSQICNRLLQKHSPYIIFKKALLATVVSMLVGVLISLSGLLFLPVLCFIMLCFSMGLGCINPTATALALQDQGYRSGTASALMGCMQFLLGTLTSIIVSSWQTGTALPLMCTMFAAMSLALINGLVVANPRQRSDG